MHKYTMDRTKERAREIYQLVEARRAQLGLSQSDLGMRAFGRPDNSAIQNLRRGSSPTLDKLDGLAAALGLELYFGPPRGESPGPASIDLDAAAYTALPFYQDVRLAAGAGALNDQVEAARPIACRDDLLRQLGVAPGDALLLTVSGDSMEPLFCSGDTVLIDRARTAPPALLSTVRKPGQHLPGRRPPPVFAFIAPDGEARVKHLRRHPRLGLIATSANPVWPPEIYEPHETPRLTIIGQVSALARTLRPPRRG